MELHAKLVRSQLSFFKPFVAGLSLEVTRKGQDKLGELMTALHRREVLVRDHDFGAFQGAWVMPKDQRRSGVILYLHGGGYTCGSLEYAKGFAATLASECGVRVFCPAYRLAPEHPYPAALDDALESYQYLLKKGYEPRQILLAGESAGGGLIYCLCLRLKQLGMALPCGLVGISPWTDLTGSGDSYRDNREKDPSMTPELLQFYAKCYTQDPTDPLCSPLFGDLTGLPPSLLFVGGDEVMLDDTRALHNRLLSAGCRSKLHIAPERWHAYVLYCLNENMAQDFEDINHFLDRTLSPARSLRWMRLDNAAKIYPAAKRRNWNNFFRLSVTLTEPIDTAVLRAALDVTVRRFPSIAVRLRRGAFWYYLEEIPKAPDIQPEKSCPLAHVPFGQVRQCAFRVLVYHDRMAVEFFHAVTDGTGGLIFLKTLTAEYLCQKYGISIPAEKGVLGRLEEPSPQELEDSFLRYAGNVKASRKEATAYHLSGTPERDGYNNLITMMLSADAVRACAKARGISVTELLCAVLIVLLVSALLTVGVRFAGRTYNSSMQLSEAQELCSTLTSVISDKLRFCGTVTPGADGSLDHIFIQDLGSVEGEGAAFQVNADGQLTLGSTKLLSSAAYPRGLRVRDVSLRYDSASGIFTVTLQVGTADSTLAETSFEVRRLNHT